MHIKPFKKYGRFETVEDAMNGLNKKDPMAKKIAEARVKGYQLQKKINKERMNEK